MRSTADPSRKHKRIGRGFLGYVPDLDALVPDALLSTWQMLAYELPIGVLYESREGLRWRTSAMSVAESVPSADAGVEAFHRYTTEVLAWDITANWVLVEEHSQAMAQLALSPTSVALLKQLRAEMGDDWTQI